MNAAGTGTAVEALLALNAASPRSFWGVVLPNDRAPTRSAKPRCPDAFPSSTKSETAPTNLSASPAPYAPPPARACVRTGCPEPSTGSLTGCAPSQLRPHPRPLQGPVYDYPRALAPILIPPLNFTLHTSQPPPRKVMEPPATSPMSILPHGIDHPFDLQALSTSHVQGETSLSSCSRVQREEAATPSPALGAHIPAFGEPLRALGSPRPVAARRSMLQDENFGEAKDKNHHQKIEVAHKPIPPEEEERKVWPEREGIEGNSLMPVQAKLSLVPISKGIPPRSDSFGMVTRYGSSCAAPTRGLKRTLANLDREEEEEEEEDDEIPTPKRSRKGRQKMLKCPQCDVRFHQRSARKSHIRTVHDGERRFGCQECTQRFGASGDVTRHVQSVHRRERPHRCEICHIKFGRKSVLDRHRRNVHRKG